MHGRTTAMVRPCTEQLYLDLELYPDTLHLYPDTDYSSSFHTLIGFPYFVRILLVQHLGGPHHGTSPSSPAGKVQSVIDGCLSRDA